MSNDETNSIASNHWKPMDKAAKGRCILAGYDSYDCGWVWDSVWWDKEHQGWQPTSADVTNESTILNRPYTHYFIPEALKQQPKDIMVYEKKETPFQGILRDALTYGVLVILMLFSMWICAYIANSFMIMRKL